MDTDVSQKEPYVNSYGSIYSTDNPSDHRYIRGMWNEWLKTALEVSGLSQAEVSRRLGDKLNRSYARSMINKMANGQRKISAEELIALSEITGQSIKKRSVQTDPRNTTETKSNAPTSHDFGPSIDFHNLPQNVPIFGTVAGSLAGGAFQWQSADPIDYARRPPGLMKAKNLYALYVQGSSMEPQYFPGDLIFINPNRPPNIGDVVVVEMTELKGQDSLHEGTLGILVLREPEQITIEKRSPAGSLVEFKRPNIKSLHRVLRNNELFGI